MPLQARRSTLLSTLSRAAVALLAAFGALSLLLRLAPGGGRKVAALSSRTVAAASCSGLPPSLRPWVVAPADALPNPRAATGGRLHSGELFHVFHATGRAFVVAPQAVLDQPNARACLAAVGRAAISELDPRFGGVGIDPRLVEPEPSWMEDGVKPALRLPWAREFVGDAALGKLYLDVEMVQGGLEGRKPMMKPVEYEGWARIARVSNNGGRHLDVSRAAPRFHSRARPPHACV